MNNITTIIALVIYGVFVIFSELEVVTETTYRSSLLGCLFVGGMISAFFNNDSPKKGIIVSGAIVILIQILLSLLFFSNPLFIMTTLFLIFAHSIYFFGWALGARIK